MQYYLGRELNDALLTFIGALNCYNCTLCNSTLIQSVYEGNDSCSFGVYAMTLVDPYGRPCGLSCKECSKDRADFKYVTSPL